VSDSTGVAATPPPNPGTTLRYTEALVIDQLGDGEENPGGTSRTATWFGPAERPLAGWWHLPVNGDARAVAVLVPPVGREHVVTTLAYRVLASELAEAGIATLRFDLYATGDSAGSQEDFDRVPAWQSSVALALTEARRVGNELPLFGVGMRAGALLLAYAATDPAATFGQPLEALVLWDPCLSGKSFMREQRAIRQVSLGAVDDRSGFTEGLGFDLDDRDVARLNELDFKSIPPPLAGRTLVLHRGPQPAKVLQKRLGDTATYKEAPDQDVMLDPEWIQPRAPMSMIREIASWLGAGLPAASQRVSPTIRTAATLPAADGKPAIVETLIASVVPEFEARLYGVMTEPAVPNGQTVVFLNSSIETHIGPGRLWTEMAREWAREGVRALRFDMSGIGDSGVRPGQPMNTTYAPEAVADVSAVLAELCPDGLADVTLIGLCSGAYTTVEAGLALRPGQVVPINMPTRFFPPEVRDKRQAVTREATQLPPGPLRALVRLGWVRKLGHRLPAPVFRLFERFHILDSPLAPLRRLVERGVEVVLVAGEIDAAPFREVRRRELAKLERAGHLALNVVPDLDHGAIRVSGQRALMTTLHRAVVRPSQPMQSSDLPKPAEYTAMNKGTHRPK
jgi:predicted alpha/beta hydrolase